MLSTIDQSKKTPDVFARLRRFGSPLLGWFQLNRERILAAKIDAEALIRLYGPRSLAQARRRARTTNNDVARHWRRVAREIARIF
jgi:hypothetical protein